MKTIICRSIACDIFCITRRCRPLISHAREVIACRSRAGSDGQSSCEHPSEISFKWLAILRACLVQFLPVKRSKLTKNFSKITILWSKWYRLARFYFYSATLQSDYGQFSYRFSLKFSLLHHRFFSTGLSFFNFKLGPARDRTGSPSSPVFRFRSGPGHNIRFLEKNKKILALFQKFSKAFFK